MPIFSKQVMVEFTADQMYELVADVNAYSRFIPLCASSKVIEAQGNQIRAFFEIARGPLCCKFTTINTFEKGRCITMNLEHGPFKHLKGAWHFTPHEGNTSEISFYLEFEFSSVLLSFVLDGLFNQLCHSMVHSFKKQAAIVYC